MRWVNRNTHLSFFNPSSLCYFPAGFVYLCLRTPINFLLNHSQVIHKLEVDLSNDQVGIQLPQSQLEIKGLLTCHYDDWKGISVLFGMEPLFRMKLNLEVIRLEKMQNFWHSLVSKVNFVAIIKLLLKEYLKTFEIDINVRIRILKFGINQGL